MHFGTVFCELASPKSKWYFAKKEFIYSPFPDW
jgi:hypothetical protein